MKLIIRDVPLPDEQSDHLQGNLLGRGVLHLLQGVAAAGGGQHKQQGQAAKHLVLQSQSN